MNNWNKILDIRQGTYTSDFRMFNPISVSKGEVYPDMEQAWCNLNEHESIHDIMVTIKHEDLHMALKREDMNDDTEHVILRKLTMIENGMITLDYSYI